MPINPITVKTARQPIRTTVFHRVVNPHPQRDGEHGLKVMQHPVFHRMARGMPAQVSPDMGLGSFHAPSFAPRQDDEHDEGTATVGVPQLPDSFNADA